MLIERSSDKGQSWKPYQYYAFNCTESFPHIKQGQRQRIDDVTCEQQYSSTEPSKLGEVIFKGKRISAGHLNSKHSNSYYTIL